MSTLTERIESAPAFQVLARSINGNRLAHGVLLHGENLRALEAAGLGLTARLLGCENTRALSHPDCFTLRPANKMRRIGIGPTRELISRLNQTPNQADRKVGIVFEADRMQRQAANAFLKTLEEPPSDTTLFLLTTRPYELLPTIRSRCLHFRLPAELQHVDDAQWARWLEDYRAWIQRLADPSVPRGEKTGAIIEACGLNTRFGAVLARLTREAWEARRQALPEDVDEAARAAIETGLAKGLRQQLLGEIEAATHQAGIARVLAGDEDAATAASRKLALAVETLEGVTGLLELNLNEQTALEHFLLRSVRIWAA